MDQIKYNFFGEDGIKMERLKGYKKIKHSGGSLITCELYNPATKDLKRIVVDDMEYQYGDGLINRDYPMEVLEAIRSMLFNFAES